MDYHIFISITFRTTNVSFLRYLVLLIKLYMQDRELNILSWSQHIYVSEMQIIICLHAAIINWTASLMRSWFLSDCWIIQRTGHCPKFAAIEFVLFSIQAW